jgi:acetyltransferase
MTFPLQSAQNHDSRSSKRSLDIIFHPKTVAVIGATETPGSVGRTVLWNLINTPFGGTVFPVNPKRPSVLGIKAYKSVAEVPEKVDMAVVCTPASAVPGVIGQCADMGVGGAIVISAGFKELGPEGAELERQTLIQARRGNMRLIGPNCLGVMNPRTGLNATFAGAVARPGNVAFLSQSGALCTAILDWSLTEMVGFSAFISTGSMLDVGWGDLIDYLGDDPHTRSILIYMESIGDARSFMSAARHVARSKPIIVIKAGRSAAAAKAAASHTGSLTGSDEVLDAAFRRAGVLRVNHISDLFYMADVLANQPRPKGPNLTILTNAGGPGVLATDALMAAGGQLSTLASETHASLNNLLPPHWSRANPVDILGDATPERYAKSLEIVSKDPGSDGMLVILTPQDMTDPTQIANALQPYSKLSKPVLASWMGGTGVAAGKEILNHAGIPVFPFPDTAARAFQYMWQYTQSLRGIYETPPLVAEDKPIDRSAATAVFNKALASGRTLLDEAESKKLLAAYGIPNSPTEAVDSADAAADAAEKMGFPVVVKLYSHTITHKSDVGGVKLNLATRQAVKDAFNQIEASVAKLKGKQHFLGVTVQPMIKLADAYEVILGSSIDPQFGPVLLFGSGGQLVEVYKDRALGLPPLNATLAKRMMEKTRIYHAFKGVRGRPPVDLNKLEAVMVRFSQLVAEQPRIKEIDINPLLVSHEGIMAVDARIILYPSSIPDDQLPKLAIRPYPTQYVSQFTLKNSTSVLIRPIRPEDEPLVAAFHGTLSEDSVRFRYLHVMSLSSRIAHERLSRQCFNDYDREIAILAERQDLQTGQSEILGIGRLIRIPGDKNQAEFAIVISDKWHNQGLGTQIMENLIEIAQNEGIELIRGDIASDNLHMQHIVEKCGIDLGPAVEGVHRAQKQIPALEASGVSSTASPTE